MFLVKSFDDKKELEKLVDEKLIQMSRTKKLLIYIVDLVI